MKRFKILQASNNTDTLFRAWINEINSALLAFGWTAGTDTGQINFSTVTRPTTTNAYQGFATYNMADSLQGTTPVTLRIDFGTGNQTDSPAIKLQVGTGGTNGSGTLSSPAGTQKTIAGGNNTAASGLCRTSGDTASFRMQFWTGGSATNTGWCVAIERDKDSSGADTSSGVNFAYGESVWNGSRGFWSQFIPNTGSIITGDANLYAWTSAAGGFSSTSSQIGPSATIGVGPVRVAYGPFRNPMKGLLVGAGHNTVQSGMTIPVTVYGSSHPYLMCTMGSSGLDNVCWQTDGKLYMLLE